MKEFEIRCTPQQTKKALNLGAPIFPTSFDDCGIHQLWDEEKHCYYDIPTAEEMLGWLEEQGLSITIYNYLNISFAFELNCVSNGKRYPNRAKVTLAAIDAALDYLSNKK